MATLFGKGRSTIAEHIGNVYEEGELEQNSINRKFRPVRKEGTREVEREIDYYNLDVIISVGYRAKSPPRHSVQYLGNTPIKGTQHQRFCPKQ